MITEKAKEFVRRVVPRPIMQVQRRVRAYFKNDFPLHRWEWSPHADKRNLAARLCWIHENVSCEHTHSEMLRMIAAILEFPKNTPGCIVEAGCYKGGSTAKSNEIGGPHPVIEGLKKKKLLHIRKPVA